MDRRYILALIAVFLLTGCFSLNREISGTAYFVDCARGKDTNDGMSSRNAWGSLEVVNDRIFKPGDGIYFKRGTTCTGMLEPQGSGHTSAPIIIDTYGRGDLPVIDAGDNFAAIRLMGQQYWEISNIETTGGTDYGVLLSGMDGVDTLHHFRINNLNIHDVWGGELRDKNTGLLAVIANGSVFHDVIIDGVTAYNTNQWAGIEVSGSVTWPIDWDDPKLAENITVRNSTVHNVYGDGIVLWGVKNGLIEHSVAYDTGQQPSPQTVGTPSSIWTWACIDCVVQYNESYNASSPEVDAGCYDIDWGTKNNLYQYNYGHNCDGYCISVFGAGGLTTENAIVRYNVCANNGQDVALAGRQGDVFISTWNGGSLDGVLIHNNTFYWSPDGVFAAVENGADYVGSRPNLFVNNIIYTTQPWVLNGGNSLEFDHNIYWYEGEESPFFSFGSDYFNDFEQYQNGSGQDANSVFGDPVLTDVSYDAIGRSDTAYTLGEHSPAIDSGIELGDMGLVDFFGNTIPQGATYDIGAHERPAAKTSSIKERVLNANILKSITDGTVTLIGFIDSEQKVSQSQVVYLRSIAHQHTSSNLRVVLVDISNKSQSELEYLASDWHLGDIKLMSLALKVPTPMVVLSDRGVLTEFQTGLVLPFDLAALVLSDESQ